MTRRLIDQDRQREQRRQAILLDRLELRFRPVFTREINRAMREIVNRFEITGDVMPPRDHFENIEREFERMAMVSTLTFGKRIIDQGKSIGLGIEIKEDFAQMMARMALLYVGQEAVRRHITSITETTRSQIVAQVARGYDEGLGVAEIAKTINANIPLISRMRGALIARTETHGAANFGANVAAKETGLNLKKEWIAAADERTRDDHADADSQTVGMDDAFDIGGESLMYPGDPNGSPEQIINCRCATGHVIDE